LLDPQKGRLIIIADEALWDLADYRELERHGGVGAINIKVPKTGGLLPALDLAGYAHRRNPNVRLISAGCLGRAT
jgi:L-alanine-DL-glutamate epimerase-like enolase superfamily enzyme